jgi:predicted enzyme related to lactoylglutathione lyase
MVETAAIVARAMPSRLFNQVERNAAMSNESRSDEFTVTETFFSLGVADMDRAIAFYTSSLGAVAIWTSPRWSSVQIAGVRVGLFSDPKHGGARTGLHFCVSDIETACASVKRCGGKVVTPSAEVAPAIFIAEVSDTEGNIFALRKD